MCRRYRDLADLEANTLLLWIVAHLDRPGKKWQARPALKICGLRTKKSLWRLRPSVTWKRPYVCVAAKSLDPSTVRSVLNRSHGHPSQWVSEGRNLSEEESVSNPVRTLCRSAADSSTNTAFWTIVLCWTLSVDHRPDEAWCKMNSSGSESSELGDYCDSTEPSITCRMPEEIRRVSAFYQATIDWQVVTCMTSSTACAAIERTTSYQGNNYHLSETVAGPRQAESWKAWTKLDFWDYGYVVEFGEIDEIFCYGMPQDHLETFSDTAIHSE